MKTRPKSITKEYEYTRQKPSDLELTRSPDPVDERWVNQVVVYCEHEYKSPLIVQIHILEAMAN